jgi:hypothetical protein
MLRQRPPRRLASLEGPYLDLRVRGGCRRHLRLGFRLRGVLFHVGERKLELLQQRAALRGWPELLVPQLGDGELHLLDQQRTVAGLGLGVLRLRLGHQQRLALRDDQRVRGREVGRERISARSHAATDHKALRL